MLSWLRRVAHRAGRGALLALGLLLALRVALAQAVDLPVFDIARQDGGLVLDFQARPVLSKAVEEAMQKGVPLYFVAQATVLRPRWYWRDERVARATRTWRLSYQPLTGQWRVSLGGLGQTVASAAEALAIVSRASGWRIAEPGEIEPGERYQVEFSFRLDNTQLPRPMQLDLAAQADWRLSVERSVRLE
ncbi:MAG: DUF4390 domain-containing protein [Burkholderiales bacterium]|nr:DUF4390 domain-containing protein [Burkholderiales bacterium]